MKDRVQYSSTIGSWEAVMMVVPSLASFWNKANTLREFCSSRAAEGSSANRTDRFPLNARAIPTRWHCPRDNSSGYRVSSPSSPTCFRRDSASVRDSVASYPAAERTSCTFSAAVSSGMMRSDWWTTPTTSLRSRSKSFSDAVSTLIPVSYTHLTLPTKRIV